MSVGKWLIFHGSSIGYLEDCVSLIQKKYEQNENPWYNKPLECVEDDLRGLINKHKWYYLMSDNEMFEVEYSDEFTIKDHWKKMFGETMSNDLVERFKKEYPIFFECLKEVKREYEPDNTLENFTT